MKRSEYPIYVTRPYLPDLERFKASLDEVWANRWLTNDGPVLKRFHASLARYMSVPETDLALFCNGTLALELGFYALGLSGGEVITTPFTFVATGHALMRIGARPVFADVDPETMCLSPEAAEKLITPSTKAIVPVHVYGCPCDTEGFRRLAEKYSLKIVYDAAHAFGVDGLAECGDMSMYSFHSTKLFHSCEGGALVFRDPALREKLRELRNFAIRGETSCVDVGTNAKMNELQSLMGLACLEKMDEILAHRRRIYDTYVRVFDGCAGVELFTRSRNKSYVPVLFADEATRERVYEGLRSCNVFARRYFYPLLTDFSPYAYGRGSCPVAEDLSRRVLALPTYHGLSEGEVELVAENVKEVL